MIELKKSKIKGLYTSEGIRFESCVCSCEEEHEISSMQLQRFIFNEDMLKDKFVNVEKITSIHDEESSDASFRKI